MPPAPTANLAVFTSGDGDGVFPTWFGLDADERAASIVTCFSEVRLGP